MRNLLNPKWLYVINTVPILLLFFLAGGEYNIIKTLLKPEVKELWATYAITLGALALLNFGYGTWLIIKKRQVSLAYGVAALITFIAYLYFYMYNAGDLIPWDVPRWMTSDNILIYGGTFLMPTLGYSLFVIIVKLTPNGKEHNVLPNFFGAVGVPILFFLFYQVVLSMWRVGDGDSEFHMLIIITISATVLFLFFLARMVYILAMRRSGYVSRYRLAWKIPITLVLPLLGLLVNNGWEPNGFHKMEGIGVFGNFSSPWFYILAVVNAVVLCLPSGTGKPYRLMLFFARAVTFCYTFYFFMVFLPFLPLSVIAIIAVGVGFLMLAPLMLFVLHVRDLAADYRYLVAYYGKTKTTALLIGGILVLPACVTAVYVNDKMVLNEALEYVYQPDYSKNYDVDGNSLANTLSVVKIYKRDRRLDLFENKQIPYLTPYFNWLVLDNMTLSDSRIQTMEKIFFGKSDVQIWEREIGGKDDITITGLKHASKYNAVKQQWESTIDLELTNNDNGNSEYQTTINLPDGCWINDYYLYAGGRKEKGILAEKKAATWVYSQIRNENRDPGILFYIGGNRVAFRVFPFAVNEVRKTGIGFIHKEPVKLNIDGRVIPLGDANAATPEKGVSVNNTTYITASEKSTLKKVTRKPYLHFIVDVSGGKKRSVEEIQTVMQNVIAKAGYESKPVVSFASTYVSEPAEYSNWKEGYKQQEFKGGFFAERALRKILLNSYNSPSEKFPVAVLVTDSLQNVIMEKDLSDIRFTYPDNSAYYWAESKQAFYQLSLNERPGALFDSVASIAPYKDVLALPASGKTQRYLRNDSLPEIVVTSDDAQAKDADIKTHDWQTGLAMHGEHRMQLLHPETAADNWVGQVKHSFASGIMSPHTSYLVVENEAQKAILRKKQEQVLSGNKSLDLDNEVQGMDEPGLLILAGLFAVYLILRKIYSGRRLS